MEVFKKGVNSFRLSEQEALQLNERFGKNVKDLRAAMVALLATEYTPPTSIDFSKLNDFESLKAETESIIPQILELECTAVELTDLEFIQLLVSHCKVDPTKAYPCDEALELHNKLKLEQYHGG